VTLEAGTFPKAVTKKLREESFIFAEGDDAVADVAGGKHVEFFAQAAAGAAVITDCNYGAEIANDGRTGLGHSHFRGSEGEALESFEQSGEAGASADGDYAQAALTRSILHRQQIGDFGLHPAISYDESIRLVIPEGAFRRSHVGSGIRV